MRDADNIRAAVQAYEAALKWVDQVAWNLNYAKGVFCEKPQPETLSGLTLHAAKYLVARTEADRLLAVFKVLRDAEEGD